jgi:type IX secretion system PorP/SprF family membrane protein
VGSGENFVTLALQVLHDRAGTTGLTSTQVSPALNFHKSISSTKNRYLSLGFMTGMMQRRFDRSKMTTNNQYDGGGDGETLENTQYNYFDGSVGISLNSEFGSNSENNYVLGAAYHHFNKPDNSFYSNSGITLSPKYVFSAGVRFRVNDYSLLTVEADHSRQQEFQETIAGIMYTMKIGNSEAEGLQYSLSGGSYLRWNDALIPTFKLDYHPFSVGMSYDVNISRLRNSSYGRGGFELSLTYIGFSRRNNSSLNAVHCPRF